MPLGCFPPAPAGSAGPVAAKTRGVPWGSGGGFLCRWAGASGQQLGPAVLLLVLEAQGVATQGVGGRWRACCCPCWWAVVLAGVVHQGLAVLGAIALHLAARGASGGGEGAGLSFLLLRGMQGQPHRNWVSSAVGPPVRSRQ
jgi:hypothetical protein